MTRCCRRYTKIGSRLLNRPGDFVVELDDAVVHGEVLDNVLRHPDLLLRVQEVILFIMLAPLFSLQALPIFFKTSLASSSDKPNLQP